MNKYCLFAFVIRDILFLSSDYRNNLVERKLCDWLNTTQLKINS